jgi:uncharacterized protein
MNSLLFIIFLVLFLNNHQHPDDFTPDTDFHIAAQKNRILQKNVSIDVQGGKLFGTITRPDRKAPVPAALIIAGSGPTDRNGNSGFLPGKNNALRMLAVELAKQGVASLRYDKRGVGESAISNLTESELRFEHYIFDAIDWIDFLKRDVSFREISVIGHSEGSLIGMVAANSQDIDFFISIAGSGRPADQIITEQLQKSGYQIQMEGEQILQQLMSGITVKDVHPALYQIFRPDVQPYLISWLRYDPAMEISKLDIPVLILHGQNDRQIPVEDAESLRNACQHAKLKIIKDMGHMMKNSALSGKDNISTYTNPEIPVSKELIQTIIRFIYQ